MFATALAAVLGVMSAGCERKLEPVNKIVLITIDTLRADRLGCYGYTAKPTSPAIDTWAKDALLFERAFAQAPWTVPSMGSLLTGRYPREAGVYTNRAEIRKDLQTLPEIFQQNGFRTASFNTNPLVMRLGFRRGFEVIEPQPVGQKIPFAKVEPLLMKWLEEHAHEKFFVWIHNSDPHSPRTEGNTYLKEPGWSPYDAEVRWVDEATGRIIDKLEQLKILDETAVIFTADHGEAFGEHRVSGHQNCMYDEVLHVPLIIRYPGMRRRGERIAHPVEVLDLYPTMLQLSGLPIPPGTRGESLVPIAQRRSDRTSRDYVFSTRYYFLADQLDKKTGQYLFRKGEHQLAVRDGEWKLLVRVPGAPTNQNVLPDWDLSAPGTRFELFNVAQDPRETQDRAQSEPEVVHRLATALEAFKVMTAGPSTESVRAQPDPALQEILRQLGYE